MKRNGLAHKECYFAKYSSLKAEGKVRFIGVTGYWPHILAHIAESAFIDVVLNDCHWNLLIDDVEVASTPVERAFIQFESGLAWN